MSQRHMVLVLPGFASTVAHVRSEICDFIFLMRLIKSFPGAKSEIPAYLHTRTIINEKPSNKESMLKRHIAICHRQKNYKCC